MRYEPGTHHRRSIRLPSHDYGEEGPYLVTVCTDERLHLLGRVLGSGVALTSFGEVASEEWSRTSDLREGIELDEFIVMPNHVHGIVWIVREATVVGAQRAAPLRPDAGQRFAVHAGSLGAIVRAFKSATTRRINELRCTPGATFWQRNYYERVIRDERELSAIREYILDNPRKWNEDVHNPLNIRNGNHIL